MEMTHVPQAADAMEGGVAMGTLRHKVMEEQFSRWGIEEALCLMPWIDRKCKNQAYGSALQSMCPVQLSGRRPQWGSLVEQELMSRGIL
ncbi:unnamed protein product [Caretta caretta]